MPKFIKVGEVRHSQTLQNTKARAGARASERGQNVLAPRRVRYILDPATVKMGG